MTNSKKSPVTDEPSIEFFPRVYHAIGTKAEESVRSDGIVDALFLVGGFAAGLSCVRMFAAEGLTPRTFFTFVVFLGCVLLGAFRSPGNGNVRPERE